MSRRRAAAAPQTWTTVGASHEPSLWMRQGMAARVAALEPLLRLLPLSWGGVVTPLVRAIPTPGSREDRTCDRCGGYTPPGPLFFPFFLEVETGPGLARLVVTGGLCADCARLEFGDELPTEEGPNQ